MGFRSHMDGLLKAKAEAYGEDLKKSFKILEDHMITLQENQKEMYNKIEELQNDIKNFKKDMH